MNMNGVCGSILHGLWIWNNLIEIEEVIVGIFQTEWSPGAVDAGLNYKNNQNQSCSLYRGTSQTITNQQ